MARHKKNTHRENIAESSSTYQNHSLLEKLIPRNESQKKYIEAIEKYPVVFGIGQAGVGKTFVAAYMAAQALQNRKVEKIVLTRPVIEAGEKLGFLPGDMKAKVHPYFLPLYDALNSFFGKARVETMIESGVIEICPLAYLRGRDIKKAFIILDEAQNTTPTQLKLILTRLGHGSQIVVDGDLRQSDLPYGRVNGLEKACEIFKDSQYIRFVEFLDSDVVRSEAVSHILQQYHEYDSAMLAYYESEEIDLQGSKYERKYKNIT